ncbi:MULTISPECIES: hypothetical protein [unclassified Thalassospira]|uniref:hypothetical protein n=1 Tax=unclassified Thalassospira TaxID=2648997 RepID=UPI0007AD6FD6|nr:MULTISPECIES: hypothetical protein [unclassified Thalassospira]KZB60263.1 hypothetical protein AUQ42_05900 [Thalassospira sp. MCCC 1A02491]MBO6772353.1 hypothetical protein [Thalassospira sp.]
MRPLTIQMYGVSGAQIVCLLVLLWANLSNENNIFCETVRNATFGGTLYLCGIVSVFVDGRLSGDFFVF